MDLEIIMLSEISETEKDKFYLPYDLSYMWQVKNKETKQIKTFSKIQRTHCLLPEGGYGVRIIGKFYLFIYLFIYLF